MAYDWTKFVLRLPVNKDLKTIYQAWSTKEGLEKWFLRQANFFSENEKSISIPSKGNNYQWFWHGYPDTVSEQRKVLDANGKDFFQFEFSGGCIVSIRLKEENGFTLVELTQENIPPDENPQAHLYIQCQLGWTFYLTNLKSVYEHGVDLRNKDQNLKNVITA
ncbi:MAG: SRPBCC domain-containing protein [Cyclobacteriaceae bacterium]